LSSANAGAFFNEQQRADESRAHAGGNFLPQFTQANVAEMQ